MSDSLKRGSSCLSRHGQTVQIFGWIGSFILGIGFYSIPKLRRMGSFALTPVWCAWGLWTSGVALRWLGSVNGLGSGLPRATWQNFMRQVIDI